jgi:hypothetical protein
LTAIRSSNVIGRFDCAVAARESIAATISDNASLSEGFIISSNNFTESLIRADVLMCLDIIRVRDYSAEDHRVNKTAG